MGDLSVVVRLNGAIVEDRVLPVRRLVRIGESADAAVSFAGADVTIVRMGDRLALRGRTLEEGEEMDISLGPVTVTVEHTLRSSTPSELRGLLDWRFAAAVALVSTVGSWMDAAEQFLDHLPGDQGAQVLTGIRDSLGVSHPDTTPAQRTATAGNPSTEARTVATSRQQVADGPRHLEDDLTTGIGYYAWFRAAVPEDQHASEAWERLVVDPDDALARRVLGRAAYDAEDYEAAAWHYRALLDRFPDDRNALLRLAWTERRRGFHAVEADLYRRILETDPLDVDALGGLSVALARMHRLDEAEQQLDKLVALAPIDPRADMALAEVEALQGREREALHALDRAIAARGQLSEEHQLELRRDIALDPAFASMRKDLRLRSLLHRHLGAASPRVLRTGG